MPDAECRMPERSAAGLWSWSFRLFLALLALGGFGSSPCFGQLTNSPPVPAHLDLPNASMSLLRVLGALALVVALFLLGVWCFKHWQRLTVYRGRAPKLNILEVKPLGQRTALYVVAYERERLLVASSPNGVRLLTPLPSAEAGEDVEPLPNFGQTLKQALASGKQSQG